MRNRVVFAVAVIAAMLVSLLATVPGLAEDELTQADVDAALQDRREATATLADATSRFERAMADESILRERVGDLAREVSRLEQDIGTRRADVRSIVLERYMSGGATGTELMFTARTFTDIPVQAQYIALMNAHDIEVLRGLESAEARHVEQQASLDASLARQADLVEELTALSEELGAALEEADANYNAVAAAFAKQEEERRRREEEERRRREAEQQRAREAAAAAAAAATSTSAPPAESSTTTEAATSTSDAPATTEASDTTSTTTAPSAPPPVITDGKTCPVNAAVTFSDTWGAARSGGRTHKGVDMIAARNAPIVAVESGTVTRTSNSTLGGLSIYFTGASGNRYYYAHLEYIADGIGAGTQATVGDLFGGNGSTGNAPDWLPHLHFQYAPPGSDWVNPYPLVKALCG